jgi:putative ABC transport system permease protein
MIKNYLKIAFRGFWRHKLFTLINILGLSIGISAALVIYLVVQQDFSFDTFYPDSDRIYRVVTDISVTGEEYYNGGVCGPLPGAVRESVPGLSGSAPFFIIDEFTLNHTGALIPVSSNHTLKFKYREDMVLADQRYFNLFPYHWVAGSKASLNQPFTVVLTAAKAKKYFPSLDYLQMLGKLIIYGDSIKTTVTGIVDAHEENTDFNFTDFISHSTAEHVDILKGNIQPANWGSTTPSSQFFVKLSPKTSVDHIEKQLNDLVKIYGPSPGENTGSKRSFHLQKLSDVHFEEQYASFHERTANRSTLYGLLIIGSFLLLLACINFINLATAQASRRAKEVGILKTMGSSRVQLAAQFLSETFLITLLSVIVSAAEAPVILKVFADFIPPGVSADFLHQPGLLFFLFLLTVAVSFSSGFYPSIILSGYKSVHVLKNQSNTNTGKTRNALLRKSLTVSQFVIAQFFIMATLMVSKQIYYALHKDLGFQKEAILFISTPWNSKNPNLKSVFMNKIKALPQVEIAGIGGASPSSDNTHSTEVTLNDGKKEIKTDVQERFGDENYIKVYKIKLLAGRNLQPNDFSKAFLINATYAKLLGFKNPEEAVGNFLNYSGKKMQIIGVTGDFYYRSLHSPIKPLVILTRSDNSYFSGTFHIALKPQTEGGGEWKKAIGNMEAAWKALYPDELFQYQFFDESITKLYESEQHTSFLLTWSACLSVIISCLGLLGLAIYTTNQRTREIGVRKVLGATVTQIVKLLSTEMVLLVVLAFVIVTPIAWWAMHAWMQSFADRTPLSWWIFLLSGAGMLLVALLTSAFQTVKASVANPAESLRTE